MSGTWQKRKMGGRWKITTPGGVKGEEEQRSCDENVRACYLMKRDVRGGTGAAVMNGGDKDEEGSDSKGAKRWNDEFGCEMMWINRALRKKGGGRGGRARWGWSGEDSLAYAGMVHWAFPALLFNLPLFSLSFCSPEISEWVGERVTECERKKQKVTVSEVMTEWGGDSDRESTRLVSGYGALRKCYTGMTPGFLLGKRF